MPHIRFKQRSAGDALPSSCQRTSRNAARPCRFSDALVASLLVVLGTTTAHAACTWKNGASTMTYTFPVPSLNVPRDAAIGSIVYSAPRQRAQPATAIYASCPSGGDYSQTVQGATSEPAVNSAYATGVPGIGVRFFSANGITGTPVYFNPAHKGTYNGDWTHGNNGGEYYGMEIVVTGQVGAGMINPSANGAFQLGSLLISVLRITSAQIVAQTCEIQADSNVDLPKIPMSALPSIGSTAGRTPLRITLANCPAKMRAIQYQLDAPGGVISTTAGAFSASETSTVQGVDLMLTDDTGNPFALATAHTLGQYNPSTGGTYPLAFNLMYYRTGTVSPGSLQGQLTYTISYQ